MARAIIHRSSEPLPAAITLDTSFLVKVLNVRDPEHDRAFALYERLVESRIICAICESILSLEFWFGWQQVVKGLALRDLHSLARVTRERLSGQAELALDPSGKTPSNARVTREYIINAGDELLAMAMRPLTMTRVALTKDLLRRARESIINDGLKPLDSVVVSVARRIAEVAGVDPHIATLDRDFRKASGVHVWGVQSRA